MSQFYIKTSSYTTQNGIFEGLITFNLKNTGNKKYFIAFSFDEDLKSFKTIEAETFNGFGDLSRFKFYQNEKKENFVLEVYKNLYDNNLF
jgi:hypothetical protein